MRRIRPAVTWLRTGAASALASMYLSRVESTHLLIVGTGAPALHMALAHCTMRPIPSHGFGDAGLAGAAHNRRARTLPKTLWVN